MAEQQSNNRGGIGILIMTGGSARRFGGRRKLLLPYEGRTFLEHILEAFRGMDRIRLSVDRPEPYADLGFPMVIDRYPGCGPLGGIAGALEECPEEAQFVVACDMPFISGEAVQALQRAYRESGGITLATDGVNLEPLFGIYPQSVLPEAQKMLSEGIRKTRILFERCGGRLVQIGGAERVFRNINTPGEYRKYIGELPE